MVYIFELGSILLVFEGAIRSFWYTRVSLNRSHIRLDIFPYVNHRGRISGPTHECLWINHVYICKWKKRRVSNSKMICFLQDGVGMERAR
jgi:hypothetical protein